MEQHNAGNYHIHGHAENSNAKITLIVVILKLVRKNHKKKMPLKLLDVKNGEFSNSLAYLSSKVKPSFYL